MMNVDQKLPKDGKYSKMGEKEGFIDSTQTTDVWVSLKAQRKVMHEGAQIHEDKIGTIT